MEVLRVSHYESPVGPLEICSSSKGISQIGFVENNHYPAMGKLDEIHRRCHEQLHQYFIRKLKKFDLLLDIHGTAFQIEVWHELLKIPHGITATYKDIASRLGKSGSERAVGRINGQNPIAIVVPCHRVIGVDRSLVGYAGGLEKKEWLLRHEGALAQLSLFG